VWGGGEVWHRCGGEGRYGKVWGRGEVKSGGVVFRYGESVWEEESCA